MDAYSWQNFIKLKNGNAVDRKIFQGIVIIAVMELIFVIDWVVSWLAGGYLTTASAIISFFIHFFGFYTLWQRNTSALLAYFLICLCLSALYIVNAIMSILTLVLNSAPPTSLENATPVTTFVFKLDGIAGNEFAGFLYYLMIFINVLVNILTFYHCWIIFIVRRKILRGRHPADTSRSSRGSSSTDVTRRNSASAQPMTPKKPIDYNIPGATANAAALRLPSLSITRTDSETLSSSDEEGDYDESSSDEEATTPHDLSHPPPPVTPTHS